MSDWRTISVALEANTAGYTQGLKGAADATRRFGDEVDDAIGGGATQARSFTDRARDAWATTKRWGSQLGRLAGGFSIVATSTRALTGGWRRITTLQDATSALTISLGDASQAAEVMDDVLNVVTGTPYNFDQFAAAAQQMVGMGIEAQKVPTYLEAIGEAAATQGGRAGEYAERLSTVFGQIASSGQLSLREVWSISQTGVNALAILANSFGVTRDEMKKMISEGAVPAGKALDALARGILYGTDGPAGATRALAGTMAELRENMSGAVGGVTSALDRLGAALIKPFSPMIVTAANGLADSLDSIAGALGNVGELLAPIAEGFFAITGPVVAGGITGIADVIGGIAKAASEAEWAVDFLTTAVAAFAATKLVSKVWGMVTAFDAFMTTVRDDATRRGVSMWQQGATSLSESTPKLARGFARAAGGAIALAAAIKGGQWLWDNHTKGTRKAADAVRDFKEAAVEAADPVTVFYDRLARSYKGLDGGFEDLSKDVQRLFDGISGRGVPDLEERLRDAGLSFREFREGLTGTRTEFVKVMTALTDTAPEGRVTETVRALEELRDIFLEGADAAAGYEKAVGKGGTAVDRLKDGLLQLLGPFGLTEEKLDAWILNARDGASATDKLEGAVAVLTPAVDAMGDAFETLSDETSTSMDRLSAWADLVDAIIGIPKRWEDAKRDWIAALQDAEKELKENGKTFDIYDEKGRANLETISDLVDEAWKAAEAFGEQGNGAEDAANMLAFMREQLILTIEKQVGSREEAERLVNQYKLTEEAIWMLSAAAEDGQISASDLGYVMKYLAEQGGEAEYKINKAGDAIVKLPSGKTVTIDVLVNRLAYDRLRNDIQRDSGMSWGQITGGRWGGIYKYAAGGLHGGGRRTAQIGKGKNMIWWDEPETGGEAYIPRLGHTGRSLSVLSEAASWYGMGIVPMAQGGIRAPLTTGAVAASGATQVTQIHGDIYVTEDDLGMTKPEVKKLVVETIRGL